MIGTATLSDCGRYRYTLTRTWGIGPRVLMILLNPSTATGEVDDPTQLRGVRQAQAIELDGFKFKWGDVDCGYGSMEFVNLFAWRSTDPKAMLDVPADLVVGPDNDRHILEAVERAALVIAAWGNPGVYLGRDRQVVEMVSRHKPLHCFGTNKNGSPKHPLYLRIPTPLVPFTQQRTERVA
jgi:hypothetical protein